jgi:hypothetical protein
MVNRIFSIIGWVGTALVFASLAIRFGLPAKDQYAYYLAVGGLVCMILYMAGQWREIGRFFGRRQARYGSLAASSVLIVLGILVAINYIGKQQSKRWDLTAAKQFSLSDQTRNVLAKLDAPLHIAVFTQQQDFQPYQDRLKEYEHGSKQVTTEFIDPDIKQTIAKQNEVQQYGTMVFTYKGRTERATSNTEQDITNAIIKVVSGQQRKVYFAQGHGEKDPTASERDGYGGIADALKRENYNVEKVVLAQQGGVPDDAAIVVIAGPRNDFFPPEVDALKKYLAKGGELLIAIDPPDTDEHYLERTLRLPHCFWCYQPPQIPADVTPLPALTSGFVTFASFNNFMKASQPALRLWSRIMAGLPGSRLLIHAHPGSHRDRVRALFAGAGIDSSRLEFFGFLPTDQFLRLHQRVDIALDSFPFNGGTTTCDALWMGVPVVSLRGSTAVGRAGASILSNVGLPEFSFSWTSWCEAQRTGLT